MLETPEQTAGLLSRLIYSWLTPFVNAAYEKPLEIEDMYIPDDSMRARQLSERFNSAWTIFAESGSPLTKALNAIFGAPFYLAGILKGLADAAALVCPFLISFFLKHLSDKSSLDVCLKLAVLVFFLQMINTFFVNTYFKLTMSIGVQARVALCAAVYSKSLRLSSRARSALSPGYVVNLISADASRIDLLAGFFHYMWSGPFHLIIIMGFLFHLIGWFAFVGFVFLVLFIPIQARIMLHLGTMRRASSKIADERIKAILEFIRGIRVIKLYAWEDSLLVRIASLRSREITVLRRSQMLRTGFMTMSMVVPVAACILTFVLYHYFGHPLKPEIIFPALAYFNLIRLPLTLLPMVSNMLVDARVSLRRLQEFLLLEESTRQPEACVEGTSTSDAISVDGTFYWDAAKLRATYKTNNATVVAGSPATPSANNNGLNSPSSATNLLTTMDQANNDDPANSSKRFTLKVQLSIPRGALVGIAGQTGSGKSSLLAAIMGEMCTANGQVHARGRIAYCHQQAWIQHGTIRHNILFGEAFDEERYEAVLDASCLHADLARLPDGDQTMVGESGTSLSGGQKQRLAIARLLYSRPDISLFDDPLSAVDAHVSRALFERAIRASTNMTRVLVTHNAHALQSCDYVYVLKEGHIVSQGRARDLHADEHLSEASVDDLVRPAIAALTQTPQIGIEQTQNGAPEERTYGNVASSVYLEYARYAGGPSYIAGVLGTTSLLQGGRVLGDVWLSFWTDRRIGSFSDTVYMAGYVASGLAQAVLSFVNGAVFSLCGLRAARALHERAMHSVSRAPLSFFETTPSGRIINRFAKDQDVVDNALSESSRSFCVTFAGSLATMILIAVVTWQVVIPLLILALLYYRVQKRYRACTRELKRLEAITRSPVLVHMSETLAGLMTIRAFCCGPQFVAQNDALLDVNASALYAIVCIQRWLAVRLETVGNFIILSAMMSATLFGSGQQASMVGLSLSYALSITGALNWCVRQAAEAESNVIASERISQYANRLPSEAPALTSTRPPPNWPDRGHIEFLDVTLRYSLGSAPALCDITLDIAGGERIGVVGRTGAGKTSLLAALFRLVDSFDGCIRIDGIDIKLLGLYDIRSRIAIIPQDPLIFTGTVRTNLDPFGHYTDHELWRALEQARLKDTVIALPEGLDTSTNATGDLFSAGQRQLLCLARALIRRSRVLVLDEATANVDFDTDQLIQTSIRTHFAGCTILTIAHRIDTIIDYDRVVVMDNGRVVECDSPQALLQSPGSLFASYARSWHQQQQ